MTQSREVFRYKTLAWPSEEANVVLLRMWDALTGAIARSGTLSPLLGFAAQLLVASLVIARQNKVGWTLERGPFKYEGEA